MFDKIGQKLMKLASIFAVLDFVSGIILLLIALIEGWDPTISLVVLICMVVAMISNWPLYAFGQIVDDVHAMRTGTQQSKEVASDELPDL